MQNLAAKCNNPEARTPNKMLQTDFQRHLNMSGIVQRRTTMV
jgi:hypothetical protein